MNKIIFYPGNLVLFRLPGIKMIGVVSSKDIRYPGKGGTMGMFHIKIVYTYECKGESSFSDSTGRVNYNYIGGNFTHEKNNNLVKLTTKDIAALNPLIRNAIILEAF